MNSQDKWVDICQLSDIAPNTGVCAKFQDQQIAIFHVNSKTSEESCVRAVSNFDPYSKANVLSRGLITEKDNKYFIASPLLKQQFCLETGKSDQDDDISILTLASRIHDGKVQLKESI